MVVMEGIEVVFAFAFSFIDHLISHIASALWLHYTHFSFASIFLLSLL